MVCKGIRIAVIFALVAVLAFVAGCGGGYYSVSVSVSVTPPSATFYGGQTQQFTASVANSCNQAVTWTIAPAGTGTISLSGLYTAPATISTQQTVTVTATSQTNTTASASATITLLSLSPSNTKKTRTITFPTPTSPVTYGVSPITLSATANSGLPVTFSVLSGPGTILGNTLTITGVGTVVVAANQAGNTNYAAAAQVTQNVVVNQAALTITASSPTVTYGAAVPAITPLYSGWVNGQSSSSLITQPTCTTAYTPTSAAGSSPSTSCSGAVDANYAISYVTGTVTVIAAPSYTLAASPASLSVAQGGSGTSTITATGVNGFTGSVTLAASGLPSRSTCSNHCDCQEWLRSASCKCPSDA